MYHDDLCCQIITIVCITVWDQQLNNSTIQFPSITVELGNNIMSYLWIYFNIHILYILDLRGVLCWIVGAIFKLYYSYWDEELWFTKYYMENPHQNWFGSLAILIWVLSCLFKNAGFQKKLGWQKISIKLVLNNNEIPCYLFFPRSIIKQQQVNLYNKLTFVQVFAIVCLQHFFAIAILFWLCPSKKNRLNK